MLKETDLVSETFSSDGILAKAIPNYKERQQQVTLSKKIQACIKEQKPLLAEAPTGVGKSLAALVPAFEHIKRTDEPVIVVTSSIILQEQYINKDIPLLEKLYDFSVSPVLIKGRQNFLCPKKANDARNGKLSATTNEMVQQSQDVLSWSLHTKTGDKSELDFVPKFPVWAQFSCVDANECTGKQCSFYSICPYYRERNKVGSSKLVVCNYHYFFTAINSEVPMIPPQAKVVIMDEGHEINAIARDFQEQKYSVNSLKQKFDYFIKEREKADRSEIGNTTYGLFERMELDQVNATLYQMFAGLTHTYKQAKTRRNFLMLSHPERTRLQQYAAEHIKSMEIAAGQAEAYLDKFGFSFESLPAMADYFTEDVIDWFVVVYKMTDFFYEKIALLHHLFDFKGEAQVENEIFWLEPMQESVAIHAKPLNGASLTNCLFEEGGKYTAIVMSATLSANRSFRHIRKDLGISESNPVEELIVSSPFDLDHNLLWYLPEDTPAGNEPEHLPFVLHEMRKVVMLLEGRTLCLFTSRKNLLEAQAFFRDSLPKHIQVVSQEDMPKQRIIDFAKANDHTVILGTKSFFTGIDIQGPNISAVLLDKLPYPMIGDPVNDHLMAEPRGFHKFSLPEGIIAMKQAFGRLNRTTEDKGIAAIYDGRIATARYKNKIFNSFDFRIQSTKDWERVKAYVKELNLP